MSLTYFFKEPATKSLILPGDAGHGNKKDKSRGSIMFCASWMGGKVKLLLIGSSENPRALKGADKAKLPV